MPATSNGAGEVDSSFRSSLPLLLGIALVATALALQAILSETSWWTALLAGAGLLLSAWGAFALRTELSATVRGRRGEIALFTLGVVGVLIALAYLSARYPVRFDLTEAGRHSLSEQTTTMLSRLDKPVHIAFFHDPLMRATVDLYQMMADQSELVTVEFHDPMLNPAQARLRGVQFAGTAIMESEGRTIQVQGGTETDIANGILRVWQGAKQLVCFLDGHAEADPFSMEAHDHVEGAAGKDGHSHGLGAQYVMHERHGLAKARHGLETLNYEVRKVLPVRDGEVPAECAVLVVAGPKVALLPEEVAAVRAYLAAGGNAFFMLEPFVETGLEPVIREFGVVLDDTIVIDDASHFWADPSAPAVTSYNRHQISRDLPLTFYPGVRSLSPTPERVPGTTVTPIVNASRSGYGETDPKRAEFDAAQDLAGPNTLMVVINARPVAEGEATVAVLGPKGGAVAAENGGKSSSPVAARSRIAVVGDSDFATNSFFHFLGNGNLFLNTVNYLVGEEDLIGLEPRTFDLPRLSLTNRQMKGTFFLVLILVPGMLALVGTAVWWRQR
jgi:ABC-type uncharacterized transport system involved in gliding motility auxiliary subunit